MKHPVSPRQGERLDLRGWKQRLGVVSLVAAAGVFLLAAQPLTAVVHAGATGQSTSGFTMTTKDVDQKDANEDVNPDEDDDPTPTATPTPSATPTPAAAPLTDPTPTGTPSSNPTSAPAPPSDPTATPTPKSNPTPTPTPTATSKQVPVDPAVPLSVTSPTVPHTGSSMGLTVVLGVLLVAIGAGLILIRRLARRDP